MPILARRVILALAWIAAVLVAHSGLERASFIGRDLVLLREVARVTNEVPRQLDERCGWLADGAVKPVAGLSLLAQRELGVPVSALAPEGARGLRIANLLLLLAGAFAAGSALRRGLVPWLGEDAARSAGLAFRVLATVHPVAVSAVARASRHGDLWAFALGAAALLLFVQARQGRHPVRLALAALCALLAGFSSPAAWMVPALAVVAEIAARTRAASTWKRLRGALLTGALFAACVLVERLAWNAVSPAETARAAWLETTLAVSPSAGEWARASIQRLGVAFLPAFGPRLLVESFVLAGAVMLVAAWPLLRAARSAPRSFGRLGLAWLAVALLALLPSAPIVGGIEHADSVFPAALAVCAGLAVATTALSGDRRWIVPAIVVLGWLPLARGVGSAWTAASRDLALWRVELERARDAVACRELLVVDPVVESAGLDLFAGDIGLLLDPQLTRAAGSPEPPRVRSIDGDALAPLLREPEVEALRAAGLALDLPRWRLLDDSAGSLVPVTERVVVAVPPAREAGPLPTWRGEIRSPFLELDPLRVRALRVRALPECSTADTPRMTFRRAEGGDVPPRNGVWLASGTGPVAVFDMQASLAWSLSGEVRRILLERPIFGVGSIEVLADDPLAVERLDPLESGADWSFTVPEAAVPKPVHGSVRWTLWILDPAHLAARAFDGVAAGSGVLRFPAAGEYARDIAARGGVTAFALEARVGDTCVGRVRGRR